MLNQAAWGGCGTSILQLFKACTSPGTFLQQTDPIRVPAMDAAVGETLGASLGGQWAVPMQSRGRQVLRGHGCGLSTRGAATLSAPTFPGVHCSPAPPHWTLPALACPWGQCSNRLVSTGSSMRFDLFFKLFFFFSSGLFMKLEQSFIYEFSLHKSVNALSYKRTLHADLSGHVGNND